jgi:subtilisin family serine protease
MPFPAFPLLEALMLHFIRHAKKPGTFIFKSSLSLAAVLVLASCGGGGSTPAADTASAQHSVLLSGVVVDGPIEGATVFLDLNRNNTHDAGEPMSLPSAANGAFQIAADALTQAQIATALLVTHVPDSARDADDGGLSLAAAGRAGFALMTPASAYISAAGEMSPVVLSPLTTLVAQEMATNGLTLAEAKEAVQAHLGLQDKDVMSDFSVAGDKALGNIARATAIALGDAGKAISQVAIQEGGIAVREQVAATVKAVKGQLPAVVASLQLNNQARQLASVSEIQSKLSEPEAVQVLNTAVDEKRRAAGTFHDYVVVFREDVGDAPAKARELMQGRGGSIRHTYSHAVKGFAVTLPEAAAEAFLAAMERNPNVDYVEVDKSVMLTQTTQLSPAWGLDRSDQRDVPLSASYTYLATGAGVRAYVVDTGILGSHVDFQGRVLSGYSAVSDGYGTTDCNGHGTHVAGTIAGATWGVAKDTSLIPVRVLGCDGSGTMSGVIAGIDWIAANAVKPAVVNMSLGGSASATLDAAIANTVAKGITVVVAAGNSSANACNYSPAREPSAITVGATASNDARASYSNFGTCLDLFAPGSGIRSTWHTSTTATSTLNGTSMASPHVAGLAAQILQASPFATPVQVTDAVKVAATTGKITDAGSGSPNLLLYTSAGASGEPPASTTVVASVGALTGSSAKVRNGWRATVTIAVEDANGAAVPGAVVTGGFTVGGSSVSCTTSTNGICSITSGNISKLASETTFSVKGIAGTNVSYDASNNALTSVTIRRP